MLIVMMDKYLRLGLDALGGKPEINPHPESVIFIPERSGDIYTYTRNNGKNDLSRPGEGAFRMRIALSGCGRNE